MSAAVTAKAFALLAASFIGISAAAQATKPAGGAVLNGATTGGANRGIAGTVASAPNSNSAATQPSASAPAAAAVKSRFDETPLAVRSNTAAATLTTPASQPAVNVSPGGMDLPRLAWSLAIVLGLIFGLRWLSKRMFAGAAAPRSAGAMRVLSRLVISPKQQVVLLQVGRRIVVAADGAGPMSALSEITDPDEVAALVAQLVDEKANATPLAFGSLFRGAKERFDGGATRPSQQSANEDEETRAEESVDAARGELSGLMDRVRLMSRQFHRS